MVDKLTSFKCNGCKMCADICPKGAIYFEVDEKGFWYPQIDYDKCISCGLCEQKCPHNNGCIKYNNEPEVYAAWSKDDGKRLECTSGGIAYELGYQIISEGGYVVGCRYREGFRGAEHTVAHTVKELTALMQSKYLQSDTAGIYSKVKKLLDQEGGRNKVLFIGTPCHNAALSNFLGKEYENLVQVEFICRGITSPKAHEKYIDYLEKAYESKVRYFRSKDKRVSWNQFGTYASFENGQEYFMNRGFDPKVVSYHKDLTVRPSCTECVCKTNRRVADITLADFWGIEESDLNPKLEYGTSAVLLNSEKRRRMFFSTSGRIQYYKKELQDVVRKNPAYYKNLCLSPKWDKFWAEFEALDFDVLVRKYTKKTYRDYLHMIGRKVYSYVKSNKAE